MAMPVLQVHTPTVTVQVDAAGGVILDVRGSLIGLKATGIRALAEDLVRDVEARLARLRYLAEPTGRYQTVRQIAPDGSTGPVLWRARARPGDHLRVLRFRLRDHSAAVDAIEHELWVALAAGPPMVETVEFEVEPFQ